jgi:hypothetical protein
MTHFLNLHSEKSVLLLFCYWNNRVDGVINRNEAPMSAIENR